MRKVKEVYPDNLIIKINNNTQNIPYSLFNMPCVKVEYKRNKVFIHKPYNPNTLAIDYKSTEYVMSSMQGVIICRFNDGIVKVTLADVIKFANMFIRKANINFIQSLKSGRNSKQKYWDYQEIIDKLRSNKKYYVITY